MDVVVANETLFPPILAGLFKYAVIAGNNRLWSVLARETRANPGGTRIENYCRNLICEIGELANDIGCGSWDAKGRYLRHTRKSRGLDSKVRQAATPT